MAVQVSVPSSDDSLPYNFSYVQMGSNGGVVS